MEGGLGTADFADGQVGSHGLGMVGLIELEKLEGARFGDRVVDVVEGVLEDVVLALPADRLGLLVAREIDPHVVLRAKAASLSAGVCPGCS